MSVRMRHTSGHTHNRRSHHALDAIKSVAGEKEGTLRLPHRVDEATGMYRGKQIATPAAAQSSAGKPKKEKGPDTEPMAGAHVHEHSHAEHENAQAKSTKGIFGKVFSGDSRPRSRSGMGGGV